MAGGCRVLLCGSSKGSPSPPPASHVCVHIRAMLFSGALAFLDHLSLTDQKTEKISQDSHAVTGQHHTYTPPLTLPPTTNFTTITTTTILQLQTTLLYLHCFQTSNVTLLPSSLDGAMLPGTSGEERPRGIENKSSIGDAAERAAPHSGSIILPLPLRLSLFMVSLLMCPVCCFLLF